MRLSLLLILFMFSIISNATIIDVVVVLGGQILSTSNGTVPGFPSEARATAATVLYSKSQNLRFIVSGGYNVGVRYNLKSNQILTNADFSFEAFAEARHIGPSEAFVLGAYMTSLGIPRKYILLEESSATTVENARMTAIILSRTNFINLNRTMTIGVLTNLFHMPVALSAFREHLPNAQVEPLFAEDWIAEANNREWLNSIYDYYSAPR